MSVTIKEYREIMNDNESSEVKIQERLDYLEALCRNVIQETLAPE